MENVDQSKEGKYDWLHGVVVPVVTPLGEDEQLDEDAMRKIICKLLDSGVQALFVLGSVGEGPMFNSQMRQRVISLAVEVVGDKIPVLAGASDNSVILVLDHLEIMAKRGAKAGVCTLPCYGWYDNDSFTIEYFMRVADKSPIPLIIYNLPRVVGFSIRPEVICKLYDHPNIAGVKDTNTDLIAMQAVAADPARPCNFKYLFGNSSVACQLFKAGADGMVCAPANIMPELAVNLYHSYCQGGEETTKKLGVCLAELCEIFNFPTTCGGIKGALELQDLCSRRTVSAWPQAGQKELIAIEGILDRVRKHYERVR